MYIPFQDKCQDTESLADFCLPFDSMLIICWIPHPGLLLLVVIHCYFIADPQVCATSSRGDNFQVCVESVPTHGYLDPGKDLILSPDRAILHSSVIVIVSLAVSACISTDDNLAACASFRT